jgi:predicted ATPase/DNA-binding SARP family transcriptional activator
MPRSATRKEPAQIKVYLLGRFQIEGGSEPVRLPTRKVELLFAYLVLHPARHAREKLAALFWGDSSHTAARNSLRNALALLNKRLGHDLILADRQTVELNPDCPLWVDALALENQASNFLDAPTREAGQVQFDLYRDDLLADFYEDWIFPLREHYRSLFLDTLLQMTQQMRACSEYERAVGFARQALAFDSANERAHQHLMFCYMALGDRSAALGQYETCRQALWEGLAVEPASGTHTLYEWIKQAPQEARPFETQITNLPIPLTSFIGRKRETAEVKALLGSSRLLTLTGPGGSGKTRLAIQVATDLLDAFKDGVWWVELEALTSEALVPQAIAKALGTQETAHQPLHEALAHFLRSKHLLLILDNCEHLIQGSARISSYLLGACPHLKILTTSREPLSISGENVWYTPTLSFPDLQGLSLVDLLLEYEGVRLFVERAKAVRSDFALTEGNAPFVTQICHRLDGIPLAIELAAARVKVLTPEQIAARLDDRFRLLTGGSRTALPRHQTLAAVIDWNYALLKEQERILFRKLGVFSGGWRLVAAEAICSGGGVTIHEVLDLLASLVDKSLVIRENGHEGESRFRMLETIRQYSFEKLLESEEQNEIQNKHLEYFVELVESAKPHLGFFLPDREFVPWVRILGPEQDNVRAALKFSQSDSAFFEPGLRMAGKLHWFWLARGQLSEGKEWLERILAKSQVVSKPVQAQAWLSAGFLGCWQGDFAAGRASLEQSLALFTEIKERSGQAFSLAGLGFAANGLGDHAQAGSMFNQSLEIAREINDKWLISFALHFTAIGTSFRGELELARSQFEEHIKLTKEGMGNVQGTAFSLFHLGRIARLQGDYPGSHNFHAEGMKMFWQMEDRRGLGYSLSGFACLALAQEDIEKAAKLFGATDSIRAEVGSLLEEVLQSEHDGAKVTARDFLGEQNFNAAWSEGGAMSLEQAVHCALKDRETPGK